LKNDDEVIVPQRIIDLNNALQACIDDDEVSGFDMAVALCIALLCIGDFGTNVKLLAQVDDDMNESEHESDKGAVKFDA